MGHVGSALRVVGQWAAGAGVKASSVAVGRGQRCGDVRPGAKAGIDQPHVVQPVERLAIESGPFRLDQRLAVPAEAKPFQIFQDAIDKFRSTPGGVEILDPQAKLAAARLGVSMTQYRRKGVPEVQPPGWRGCETCDLQDSLHDKGVPGDS